MPGTNRRHLLGADCFWCLHQQYCVTTVEFVDQVIRTNRDAQGLLDACPCSAPTHYHMIKRMLCALVMSLYTNRSS
ncbi:hypothetical protein COCSUDRAFT_32433, partial [Coccomyxa subellipsoidea C-169]